MHAIAITMEQTVYASALTKSMLTHIEPSIRTSLDLVFGPRTLFYFISNYLNAEDNKSQPNSNITLLGQLNKLYLKW